MFAPGFWISVLLSAVVVFLGITLDMGTWRFSLSNAFLFFDLPSLMIVVLPAILFAFATSGPRLPAGSPGHFAQRAVFWKNLGKGAVWLGVIGGLGGLLAILPVMREPTKIGPAMAVAVLSMVYALMIKILSRTAANALLLKEESEKAPAPDGERWCLPVYLTIGLVCAGVLLKAA